MDLPIDGASLGYQTEPMSIIQKAHPRRREQALVLKMKFLHSFWAINFINFNFSEFSLSSYFHHNSIY